MQSELSNIKMDYSEHGNVQYVRIVKGQKRDRATSLCYGLSVIYEWEEENRYTLFNNNKSHGYDLLNEYTYV